MKTLTVIPVIDIDKGKECFESIIKSNSSSGIEAKDVLIVDNTKDGIKNRYSFLGVVQPAPDLRIYRDPDNHNLGVARSWNIGAREVVERKLDYLIIMSQAMLFGPEKEVTWTGELEARNGEYLVEALGHSWHLIALHRKCFEAIGYFDENFYPAYFEQIDWSRRLELTNLSKEWPRVWVNALSTSVGAYSYLTLPDPLLAYYREKWGGDKGNEQYRLPFNGRAIDFFPDNSIPELAKKYKLREWW